MKRVRKKSRARPTARSVRSRNPTHSQQNLFMDRLHKLLRDQAWEEVQVPSRATHIDRLLDFRGQSLEGGLFHLLRPWCEGRLVSLEHESGDPDTRKLRMQMGKVWMAAAGRAQGDIQWPMVEPTEPVTLLVISHRARPAWFNRWGLPMRLVVPGLWVNERDQMNLVVVRPNHLSFSPGGAAWAIFHPHLSRAQSDDLFDRLLGDPLAATLHKETMADLLHELHPQSIPMNPQPAELVGTSDQPIDKSPWHLALRVQKREREAADRRVAEAEQRERAAEHRERAAEQRERAAEQRERAAEQRERRLMLRILTAQGVSTTALENCDLEVLRKMVADQD